MNDEWKKKLTACFPTGCRQNLEQTEALLELERFTSLDALALGQRIVENSRKYGEDIAVFILRESDNVVVFQFVGDQARRRNLDFAQMKRATVLRTGHCSLWAAAAAAEGLPVADVFREDSGCLPGGGAFPVFVQGEHTYTIALSGLHHGNDHPLIIESLAQWSGKKPMPFPGTPI